MDDNDDLAMRRTFASLLAGPLLIAVINIAALFWCTLHPEERRRRQYSILASLVASVFLVIGAGILQPSSTAPHSVQTAICPLQPLALNFTQRLTTECTDFRASCPAMEELSNIAKKSYLAPSWSSMKEVEHKWGAKHAEQGAQQQPVQTPQEASLAAQLYFVQLYSNHSSAYSAHSWRVRRPRLEYELEQVTRLEVCLATPSPFRLQGVRNLPRLFATWLGCRLAADSHMEAYHALRQDILGFYRAVLQDSTDMGLGLVRWEKEHLTPLFHSVRAWRETLEGELLGRSKSDQYEDDVGDDGQRRQHLRLSFVTAVVYEGYIEGLLTWSQATKGRQLQLRREMESETDWKVLHFQDSDLRPELRSLDALRRTMDAADEMWDPRWRRGGSRQGEGSDGLENPLSKGGVWAWRCEEHVNGYFEREKTCPRLMAQNKGSSGGK
ncbi:Hypothetical predicted protein [Lecanosticta acicola]|uniref:Uncharacterized protein n=1 Tax=Lecanosticta acicola TaxID=111012 RepID=A0AAI8Z9H8_9PEZI|nr:Hypothetical predicted protein [Lecanosticta acicola]